MQIRYGASLNRTIKALHRSEPVTSDNQADGSSSRHDTPSRAGLSA